MLALFLLPLSVVGAVLPPLGQNSSWLDDAGRFSGVFDGVIAAACYATAAAVVYFVRKRQGLPFARMFLLVAVFAVACGTTHALQAAALGPSLYSISGWIKGLTAVLSVLTVAVLFRVIPQALQLPSPDLLRQTNEELEQHVQKRTSDLSATNERLAREVQQREQAEAEVRRLNESLQHRLHELQALLDLLPVGIAIAQDPECRDIRTNRLFAEMVGIPREENASLSAPPIKAPTYTILQHGRELSEDELPMQRAAKENRAFLDFEETIRRKDGRELHVVISAVPLRDAAGNARGCVAAMQDITSQKLAAQERLSFERRLQETQKLESLGVMAGGIAHDFNNLLTGIMGNASIARLELPSGYAPVRSALDNLEHAAMRAADLCKQMLAYAGKGRFVVQPLSLNRLVKETTELLEISINKKAALQFQLAEGLPAFQGDATQIRQVLMNMVVNASEAMGDRGGVIYIRTNLIHATHDYLERAAFGEEVNEGRYVCLEIADTGAGMDKTMLARIFDPFFTTKFTGRGLGLAAVMGIVRGHRGAIKVYSEVGQGTTFRLLFPAQDLLATPPDPVMHAGLSQRHEGTILVVDDEEAVRAVAARILRNAGLKVVLADDGAKAVEIVRTSPEPFTAVLLDLTMPRMDGEEAFHLLRQLKPTLRVIVMSGFNEQDTTHRFVGRGLAGFVSKPFTAEMLMGKVNAVLRAPVAS